MWFEWDLGKDRANRQKHGVSFETATLIFDDPGIMSTLDRRFEGIEERWQAIGKVHSAVIYVAFILKERVNEEEIIRIISARKATLREKRRYYTH